LQKQSALLVGWRCSRISAAWLIYPKKRIGLSMGKWCNALSYQISGSEVMPALAIVAAVVIALSILLIARKIVRGSSFQVGFDFHDNS
jgi:hypothetical protein